MKWSRLTTGILLACSLGLIIGGVAQARLDVPSAPPLDRPIVDQTGTLDTAAIDQIADAIAKSRTERDYQIGVLMVGSLSGDSLEEYSIRVAREWGIGDAQKHNGVLLLIAKDDRRVRIEVGKGLEGDLTDARAGRIIRNTITPKFRQNDYAGGILAAVGQIQSAVRGEPDRTNAAPQSRSLADTVAAIIPFAIMALFFGMTWLTSVLGRSKSWWAGGVVGGGLGAVGSGLLGLTLWSLAIIGGAALIGLLFDYYVSKNYKEVTRGDKDHPAWWAGGTWFGGGGGGGGGFGGGFGGGGFSGGGSSGSW